MTKMLSHFGGFAFPLFAMGLSMACWVYQSVGNAPWAAVTAVGFIIIQITAVGVIYGKFSTRLDTFEKSLPMMIDNSIFKMKEEFSKTYQTKDVCEAHHERSKGRGAGA